MRVVMIGAGYVGLVSSTCLAEIGHEVVCVDMNEHKINLLNQNISPIFEPGLENLIKKNREQNKLSFTTNLKNSLSNADIVFIAVGTPENEDGSANLDQVYSVAIGIGQQLQNDMLVVIKSTVPVSTCEYVQYLIDTEIAKRDLDIRIYVASNPEFLKEGDAINDFLKPDRIIVGVEDQQCELLMKSLYKPFIIDDPSRLLIMDRKSSELSKYSANAMLATRISFMNELSQLCEKVGANIDNIRLGMGSDPRIGKKFLYAGPGYGGSCFPKDVAALISTGNDFGIDLTILDAVTKSNENQKVFVANKIKDYFKSLKDVKIGIWGLSFKPNTDDVRESPSETIIKKLLHWGYEVVAHDPIAIENFSKNIGEYKGLSYCKSAYATLKDVNAMVLVTEWDEYKRPDWAKISGLMKEKVVFDFRNQYDATSLFNMGFLYRCVGRPNI